MEREKPEAAKRGAEGNGGNGGEEEFEPGENGGDLADWEMNCYGCLDHGGRE